MEISKTSTENIYNQVNSAKAENVDLSNIEKKVSASFANLIDASETAEVSFSARVQKGNWCVLLANQLGFTKDAAKTLLTLAIKEYNIALHHKFDETQLISYVEASEKLITTYMKLIKLELSDMKNMKDTETIIAYFKIAKEACKHLKQQAPYASCLPTLQRNLLTTEISILFNLVEKKHLLTDFDLDGV
ncbi:MAG: hypothetical protein H0X29_05545 [Parachlamydiaceae bacterium]|nr:hypothetical protein [Parachlamydiaceae bacterium]